MIRYLLAFLALLVSAPAIAAPGTAVVAGRQVVGTAARPCKVDGAYKWLDGMKGDASGMTIDGCAIDVLFRGIELTRPPESPLGVARNVTIRNSTITLKRPSAPGTIPTGIQAKWGEHILIENVTAQGFGTSVPAANLPDNCKAAKVRCIYPNGDAFGSEFARWLTYRNTIGRDSANGCYDDKAWFVLYDNVLAERCDYGIRAWWRGAGNFRATTVTMRDIRKAPIHLMDGKEKGAADITIDHLVIDNAREVTPVLMAEAGTSITIRRCTIRMPIPAGHRQAFGGTKAKRTLGPGCMDAAGNVIIAPAAPAAPPASGAVKPAGTSPAAIDVGEVLKDGDGDGRITLSAKTADRLKLPRGTVLRPLGGTRYEIIR